MSHALVLLWLGTAAARADHESDLASWAASRSVEVDEPSADASPAAAGHDDARAAELEQFLSSTRSASFGADPGAAKAALDALEAAIESEPGLPEAPWLLSEAWRIRAALSTDPQERAALERAARSVDGVLAPSFSDASTKPPADVPGGKDAIPVAPSVQLEGPLPGDRVYVDGRLVERTGVSAGKHHVRVLRRGTLAGAGWVTAAGATVRIPVSRASPCSDEDFEGAFRDGRPARGSTVACPDWIAARPAGPNRVEVARCRQSECGPFLPWSRTWGSAFQGPAQPRWPPPPSRAWITWTVAGVLAAAGTTVALWQAGAFEREGAPRETVVWIPPARPAP